MDALKQYAIPVRSLGIGMHEFNFEIDWSFFRHFSASPVEQGRFDVQFALDKQHDHLLVRISVQGLLDTECDRCLAPIAMPVQGEYGMIVKYDDERVTESHEDVVYITRDAPGWQVAQLIYEFVLLSIPVSKTYDCRSQQPVPCDEEALQKLDEPGAPNAGDSVWDVLKQIE
ncbi:MAG: DUF177 domain-containing protein [Saprospiraceae bacterium]|nr:DUF177 domain-containing protein [Saprospiraceae bacterium]